MKKAFFSLAKNPGLTWYVNCKDFRTKNNQLGSLYLALDPIQDFEVNVDADEYSVLIYSRDSIKKAAKIYFQTSQEWRAFDDEYEKYYDKRWDEIPKIELSLSDWQELQQKWNQIKEEKPQYIMFTLDDSGPLDKVQLIGKHELSQEDIAYMNDAHEEYLAWQKAEQLYNYDHEIIDDVWRSPADSVYDIDIAKYLGRETGFVEHKKYTRLEAIAEFKERLQRGEPVYLAVHWLFVCSLYNIALLDLEKDPFLWDISLMDSNPTDMARSREQLIEMADRVLAGQNVRIYDRD